MMPIPRSSSGARLASARRLSGARRRSRLRLQPARLGGAGGRDPGVRSGRGRDGRRRRSVQGHSLCGAPGGRSALGAPKARDPVVPGAAGACLRSRLHAADQRRRLAERRRLRRRGQRGLPDPEHLDAGQGAPRAGDGVAAWRRQYAGGRLDRRLRRDRLRPRRRGAGDAQLSPGRVRLLRPPGAHRRGRARRAAGQLRPDGSDRGAEMGARQHRRVRRRSGQRHPVRRIGRRGGRPGADGLANGQGPVRQGDRRVGRRLGRAEQPGGAAEAGGRSGPRGRGA